MSPITLATLPQASAQDVFDFIATHLLTQGERALSLEPGAPDETIACVYRTSTGLKDAAGCLMSDDEYSVDMEGYTWESLATASIVPSAHTRLITDLSSVHDDHRPEEWMARLKKVAVRYSLETAGIEHLSQSKLAGGELRVVSE